MNSFKKCASLAVRQHVICKWTNTVTKVIREIAAKKYNICLQNVVEWKKKVAENVNS